MIYDRRQEGYTVAELHQLLGNAVAEGYGGRLVLFGPITRDVWQEFANAIPSIDCAVSQGQRVHGIEINDHYEEDVCWLYPSKPD